MKMKIWELNSVRLDGAIRTTPEGDAEIEGLVLSEKAYLTVVRDLRPEQLVEFVRRQGPVVAARRLVAQYGSAEAMQEHGGRRLVLMRGQSPGPIIRRSDEIAEPVLLESR
jgi:hypothetical protein